MPCGAAVDVGSAPVDRTMTNSPASITPARVNASSPVTSIDTSLIDRVPAAAGVMPGATPQVRVAEAERAAAESRIEVERIRARPDVRASVGVRRYEAEDATALTFGLSVPLPLFDRNRGNIEAAQADFRAADARLMGARQEAEADRNAAQARLRASVSRVTASDAAHGLYPRIGPDSSALAIASTPRGHAITPDP